MVRTRGKGVLAKKKARHQEINEARTFDAGWAVYQKGAPKGQRVNHGYGGGW